MEGFWGDIVQSMATVIAALIGIYQILRLERAKHQEEIKREQRYVFFLPFKFSASEFNDRIKHVEKRLSFIPKNLKEEEWTEDEKENIGKKEKMRYRLGLTFKDENSKEWYFKDGYFITSTIYMNCILFYRMKEICTKYPYIPLKLNVSLNKLIEKYDDQIVKYQKHGNDEKDLMESELNNKYLNVDVLIRKIKITISQANGIPYALHDSFGEYIANGEKLKTYDEFVDLLVTAKGRIKFEPLIRFWTNILPTIDGEDKQEIRMNKLRKLIPILELVEHTELSNR